MNDHSVFSFRFQSLISLGLLLVAAGCSSDPAKDDSDASAGGEPSTPVASSPSGPSTTPTATSPTPTATPTATSPSTTPTAQPTVPSTALPSVPAQPVPQEPGPGPEGAGGAGGNGNPGSNEGGVGGQATDVEDPDAGVTEPEPSNPEPTSPEPTSPAPTSPEPTNPSPSEPTSPNACPDQMLGWVTVGGAGIDGSNVMQTTGGGNATPVRPTTAQQLMDYAADDQARVIEIQGTFQVPRLQINSNKTLIGIGNDATIEGGLRIRGSASNNVRNVIVRNLRVNGATTQVDADSVQIYFAHHVWIDHCEIWDGPDGNLDMTHAVDWVTVSWTKFHYTNNYQRPSGESSDHRFSSLIGHSDSNASEDAGRLKITFHHNWWSTRVIERMPRVRFGQVHVFNNYFAAPGNNYCVRAGREARILVENNTFQDVSSPYQFNSDADQGTAHITARNNRYINVTGDYRSDGSHGGGTPFTQPGYSVQMDDPEVIPELVQRCAGPR